MPELPKIIDDKKASNTSNITYEKQKDFLSDEDFEDLADKINF